MLSGNEISGVFDRRQIFSPWRRTNAEDDDDDDDNEGDSNEDDDNEDNAKDHDEPRRFGAGSRADWSRCPLRLNATARDAERHAP